MLLVTAEEMRALDREVIEDIGVPGVVLMESAGRGVADVIGGLCDVGRSRVVIYAGPGNNGGDGFVVARHLANRGAAVEVVMCAPPDKVGGDARVHLEACLRSGVPVAVAADGDGLARAAARTGGADVVVDALLGTGLAREVTGHFAQAIEDVNAHRGIKVAVDIPSGLSADRGVPLGACVRADHTVTFAFAKRGLVAAPGFVYTGRLHVVDIGIPRALAERRGVRARLLDDGVLGPLRAPRDPLGHKGRFGHVLLVAGSPGKVGAALLAGRAALRTGAGLCTLAVPRAAQARFDGQVPELMTEAYDEGDGEALGRLLATRDVLAVGPGMPTGEAMRAALHRLFGAAAGRPIVVDADGLNHLAADPSLGAALGDRAILTPHPGEAARLLGSTSAEVQADRFGAAEALAARFRAVVVLKGARTVIVAPDGRLAITPAGNPGLGTGGTGDVLTGCTAALLAQGLAPFDAAAAAVHLHARAGDVAAAEKGEAALVAGDVIDALPALLRMTG